MTCWNNETGENVFSEKGISGVSSMKFGRKVYIMFNYVYVKVEN